MAKEAATAKDEQFMCISVALVVVGAWALTACDIQGIWGVDLQSKAIKTYRAEDFFQGRKLEIAKALEAGDMRKARELAPGVDLAAPADKKMTLMWFFLMPGTKTYPNYAAVRELVALGVDPHKQGGFNIGTAVVFVLWPVDDPTDKTGVHFFQAMLDGGLPFNQVRDSGNSLLHDVVDSTLDHVKLLVEKGADINAKTASLRNTPLSESIYASNPDIALYLVQQGAHFEIEAASSRGITPAWLIYSELQDTRKDHPYYAQLEQVRDLMIAKGAKGAKWPPDAPEVVLEQMRAKGLTP